MERWELIFCDNANIKKLLEDGWEPFAVTCEPRFELGSTTFQHTVWLRRKVREGENEQ